MIQKHAAHKVKYKYESDLLILPRNIHNINNEHRNSCNKNKSVQIVSKLLVITSKNKTTELLIIVTIIVVTLMIIIMRVLMVEIIMIIEVLVTMAVIIIVKIMTYGRNSMENEKRRTLMEQKTGQVNMHKNIFHYKTSQALNGNVKNYYQKKT